MKLSVECCISGNQCKLTNPRSCVFWQAYKPKLITNMDPVPFHSDSWRCRQVIVEAPVFCSDVHVHFYPLQCIFPHISITHYNRNTGKDTQVNTNR